MDGSRGGGGREEKAVGLSPTVRGRSESVPQPLAALPLIARAHASARDGPACARQITPLVSPAAAERKLSRTDPFPSLEHLATAPPGLCYEHVTIKAPLCETPGQSRAVLCFPQLLVRHCPSDLLRRQSRCCLHACPCSGSCRSAEQCPSTASGQVQFCPQRGAQGRAAAALGAASHGPGKPRTRRSRRGR